MGLAHRSEAQIHCMVDELSARKSGRSDGKSAEETEREWLPCNSRTAPWADYKEKEFERLQFGAATPYSKSGR